VKPWEPPKDNGLSLTIQGQNLPRIKDLGQLDEMRQFYGRFFWHNGT
jgi:hypothetical protein